MGKTKTSDRLWSTNNRKLEVVSSLAAILKQQLEKTSQGYLVDLTGKSPINRTYGEIWQRSTILLGYLQAQGLSPGFCHYPD